MRSALFVDFDNVFSGLARLGPDYAEAFARSPSRWLNWLVEALEAPAGSDESCKRRVLVRRCYLNPEPYKRFRIGFSRAGFEIVDCPPMTSAGKTSTDIHMVLDMVDVLQSSTRYDEFIVFSADADFTPLLRKLRREDRRTTIFAAGATSASYDASADLIIDPEAFIREALGLDDEDAVQLADSESLAAQAEAVVWRVVDQASQPVPLPALTKALANQVVGLVQSNWAGRGNFLALLKSLPIDPLRIDRERNALVDPRRLGEHSADCASGAPHPPANADRSNWMPELEAMLLKTVNASDGPVPVARLAQMARDRFSGIEKSWLGQGTWKKLLEQLQNPGMEVVWVNQAGYALVPGRHVLNIGAPDANEVPHTVDVGKPSAELATWLAAAGLPSLERGRYRALLEGLSIALDVRPFSLADATKLTRDHCVAQGQPVSRQHANTVLRGLLFNGFDPVEDGHGLQDLVVFTSGIVSASCRREGLKMSDADKVALAEWMSA
jgi:hypothetical protein